MHRCTGAVFYRLGGGPSHQDGSQGKAVAVVDVRHRVGILDDAGQAGDVYHLLEGLLAAEGYRRLFKVCAAACNLVDKRRLDAGEAHKRVKKGKGGISEKAPSFAAYTFSRTSAVCSVSSYFLESHTTSTCPSTRIIVGSPDYL